MSLNMSDEDPGAGDETTGGGASEKAASGQSQSGDRLRHCSSLNG